MAGRALWLLFGLVSLGLAFLGVALPILPTTPFLLLAAFAFARSSPRLEHWLVNHRHFGVLIRNWQRDGSIDRRTKYSAVVVMALAFILSLIIGASKTVLIIQAVVLTGAATFVLSRPDASDEEN